MLISRHLQRIAFHSDYGRQMRFIAGPRQSGKTTIARHFLLTSQSEPLYYNWDNRKVRDAYIKDNHFFVSDVYNIAPATSGKRWLCMDEIHKFPGWKNILKDFFDSFGDELTFIVTGSARLDMMRKSGDSLTGRYFIFRLNPVTLSESTGAGFVAPPDDSADLVREKLDTPQYNQDEMLNLLRFSGFPEPLISGSKRFHTRWRYAYLDTLVREEIREITRIKNLEKTAMLMQLLPSRIASPLSINAVAKDLHVSFQTAANYLSALELGYLIFRIPPYQKKIARSLKKEKKVYFYDWTRVDDAAGRFENYIGVELKSRLDLWEDAGFGTFKLNYIRNRDGRETDFLVVRNDHPWLLIEVKLSPSPIDYHHLKNQKALGDIPFVQLVRETGVAEKRTGGIYQMSASRFFG